MPKKIFATLAIFSVFFACSLPSGTNSVGSLATKADAIKYFECALNRPGITEEEKNKIKTIVISQINLIPDIAWEKAKVSFENYAKLYGCNTNSLPSPSASASISSSSSPIVSPSSPAATSLGILSSKEEYIKYLQCIYNGLKEAQAKDKKNSALVLNGIEVYSELNATRFLDDKTFEQQKARFEALVVKYKQYCADPNATPTPVPTFSPIKTVNSVAEYSCDAEKSLKSSNGQAVNLTFLNNYGSNLKIYWLDSNGARKVYNNSLAISGKYNQATYVTHPWLITDTNDNCLKIYVAQSNTASTIEISK